MSNRTYDSPATQAQVNYIKALAAKRKVPRWISTRLAQGPLTDGDCRKIIPDLEDSPLARPGSGGWGPDHDLGDWENWRDHPDAIAGHPMEHGSH